MISDLTPEQKAIVRSLVPKEGSDAARKLIYRWWGVSGKTMVQSDAAKRAIAGAMREA